MHIYIYVCVAQDTSAPNFLFLFIYRSISAPVNYKEFLHIPMYTDFTDIFLNDPEGADLDEQKFVSYNEDKASEQQTESDMKNLEGKINMSLQQMKERIFSTVSLSALQDDNIHRIYDLAHNVEIYVFKHERILI